MEDMLQPLVDLTDGLGIPRQALVEGETANRVFVETEVLCSAAKTLTFEHIESAMKSWAGALLLRITSQYGIRELNVSDGSNFDRSAFAEFREDVARAGNDETINVRLSVDKNLMVQKKIAVRSGTNVLAYLFLSNLTRALSGPLGELAQLLFAPQPHCCCVVLDAPNFVLEGPYLAVWGRALFDARYAAVRPARNDRLQTARDLRADQTSWLGFDTSLTPYEFLVTECSDRSAEMYLSVLRLQYLLVILYLADSVRCSNGGFVATFSGTERAELKLSRREPATTTENPTLTRLFVWAYSARSDDKLPTLRSVIAATLVGDRTENSALLWTNSQKIFVTARSNYAALVGGFVIKYFDKLKEANEYVRNAGNEIADRISDLTKTLTANLLATVGVAVGGFIAYALDKKSSPKLLSIGLDFYGVYILVFALLYSLVFHGLVDFWITRSDFKRNTRDLEATLHIVGLTSKTATELKGRIRHFWFILVSSALVYLTIGIACFILGKLVDVAPPPSIRVP